MKYKCECGKEFDYYRKFLGHKSHCEIHLKKVGKWEKYLLSNKTRHEKTRNTYKLKKSIKNDLWALEKHTCEHCGKVMTEKFGSGRFCSRSCANSKKQSEESNNKRREKMIARHKHKRSSLDFHKCIICGKEIKPTKLGRFRKTCSRKCLHDFHRLNAMRLKKVGKFSHPGGYREGSVKNYKSGKYKGIYFDSSWELAFIVYCQEHNIDISRNKKSFDYLFEGKIHKYYPDFIDSSGTYIEIKNYHNDQVQAKIDQFPKNLNYKILYYKDLKHMIKYCVEKYGENYVDILKDIV